MLYYLFNYIKENKNKEKKPAILNGCGERLDEVGRDIQKFEFRETSNGIGE